MKRLIGLFSLCVWAFGLYAQTGEFNPDNPGDPFPLYRLQVQVSPSSGGTASMTKTQLSPGDEISLYVIPATNYVFQQWVCGDSVVSTESAFRFTMPARNVTITAQMLYEPAPFNPPSPGDPQSPIASSAHKVTLYTSPSIGGWVSESVFTLKAGEQQRIYAYPNTGYEFLGWYAGDNLVSQSNVIFVTMADEDISFTARFLFNPVSPDDPGTNWFDANTGELVFDRFQPNNLRKALYAILGNSSYENVLSLKILGEMGSEDAFITSVFPNVTTVNLSQTTGYNVVPNRAFDGLLQLTQVLLPSSVNTIDRRAFYGCPQLSNLVVYALTPPKVDSAFVRNLPQTLIVQVPAGALPLYQADPVWSQLTLHALDSRSLTVAIPEQTADLYRNMYLELLDTKSGQLRRYVITERTNYTYDNVFKQTPYRVTVRNAQGRVMGQSEFTMPDADTAVTFAHLLQPVDIAMTVVNSAGADLTDQVIVTWANASGGYLRKGSALPGQVEGDEVTCTVTLGEQTGGSYLQPAPQTIVITPAQTSFTTVLTGPALRELAGSVLDAETNMPVRSANIVISQVLNGKYPKSYTAQTDQQGLFSATILAAQAELAVSASNYSGRTIVLPADSALAPIALQAISGTAIGLSFRYSEAVPAGELPIVQDWYQDYQNIDYVVYDRTQERRILGFEAGAQQIALPIVLPDGDSVEMTATSRKHHFAPVTVGGRAYDNRMALTLPLTELGGIQASYNVANGGAVALLYDASGSLLQKTDYADKQVAFEHLDGGDYTLVSLQLSDLLSGISRLQDFANIGLEAGRDFVQRSLHVADGFTTAVVIDTVPLLNVPELNYTAATTSFTSNKTSVVSGTYLTLRGKLEFKPAYKDSVSNVELLVDLPESAVLVDDAVMAGSRRVTNYTTEGQRVIIPVENVSDLIRFCVIPTTSGEFRPGAYVRFTYKGRRMLQPIGSAYYKVEDASINVIVNYTDMKFLVSGQSMANSEVKIYDGDAMIGSTTVTPSGSWSAACAIPNAYNLSVHDVYAKITTPSQFGLTTQSQSVKIMFSDIRLESIAMSFHNSYSGQTIEVLWDYLSGKASKKSYSFYTETPFTFKVKFSNNSPQYVQEAILQVYTDNNAIVSVPLSYDSNLDRWVGRKSFGAGALPVRAGVRARFYSDVQLDSDQIHEWLTPSEVGTETEDSEIEALMQQIQAAISAGNWDLAASLLDQLDTDITDDIELTEAEVIAQMDSMDYANHVDMIAQLGLDFQAIQDSLAMLTAGTTVSTCAGLDSTTLAAQGFISFPKTQGGNFYVFTSENRWEVIDFEENIHYSVDLTSNGALAAGMRAMMASGDGDFMATFNTVNTLVGQINDFVQAISGVITTYQATLQHYNDAIRRKLSWFRAADRVSTHPLTKQWIQQNRANYRATINFNNSRLKVLGEFKYLQVSKFCSILSIGGTILSGVKDAWELDKIRQKVMPCPDDINNALQLRQDIIDFGNASATFYLAQAGIAIAQFIIFETSVSASLFTVGSSLAIGSAAMVIVAASYMATLAYNETFDRNIKTYETRLARLKCHNEPDPTPTPTPEPPAKNGNWKEFPTGFDPVTPILDPSGYVYEAVNDNRVEGVQATIYYKGTRETAPGVTEEVDVLWDAENYDQQNPLYTDAQGMYQWDVPQGMWQVRFEKEGYEPTQSEWLPVPPPQLEVNIPIVQLRQPEVLGAEAFTDAINITFDKFMRPDLLTADNIFVTAGDQVISGTLSLLNEKEAGEESYASRVRFVPDAAFTAAQVTLTVSNRVRSYADVAMSETYQQTFEFEQLIPLVPAEPPVASLPSGSALVRETELFLSSETPNAVIRYTLDGTEPDCETGLIFNPDYPILLSAQTLQVKAIACAEGYEASQLAEFVYSFNATPTDISQSTQLTEPVKLLQGGHLYILLPDGTRYDATGKKVE